MWEYEKRVYVDIVEVRNDYAVATEVLLMYGSQTLGS